MKSSPKPALIISVIIAAIILIIAALTTPSGRPTSRISLPEGDASITLLGPVGGTVEVGQPQHIKWTTENYGSDKVAVNILRKISDGPAQYELVRTVSPATANDGDATWVPSINEVGPDIFVEVACVTSDQGCRVSHSATPMAVIDSGRNSNTASVYSAIEKKANE